MSKEHAHKPLFETPGIIVVYGTPNESAVTARIERGNVTKSTGERVRWFSPGEALRVGMVTRTGKNEQIHIGEDGIQVFFDGYLSAAVDHGIPGQSVDQPAALIADLYRRERMSFLLLLRGSFTCVVYDAQRKQGWLFNDRLGSRQMYFANADNGTLCTAPKIRDLVRLLGNEARVNRQAITEFLISGSCYADHTIFEQIRLFPQAGLLNLATHTNTVSTYWALQFSPPELPADEANLLDECDSLLEQAVKRSLRVSCNPVLAMSGGIDSRVLLTYLLKTGFRDIPLISYGVDASGKNDVAVSRQIASALNLQLQEFSVDPSTFSRFSQEAVWRIDGRADILDAPSLLELWDKLGNTYDSMFQGDQCFGWHGDPVKPLQALELFNRRNLDAVPRLSSWIDPATRRVISSGIAETQQQMLQATRQLSPNDIKDVLFFEQAVGNVQNTFASARRQSIEQLRPLLDEDILEFVSRLPAPMRANKYLLRAILKRSPHLKAIPVADTHALPMPTDYLCPASPASRSVLALFRRQLRDGLHHGLSDWIDPAPIAALVNSLENGTPLPPVAAAWWQQLPLLGNIGSKRLARAPHPFITIRHLMVIDLYLKSVQASA